MLKTTTHFGLQRDEDNRVSRQDQRTFQMALRWRPTEEPLLEVIDIDARRVLNRLASGDEISSAHMKIAVEYLERSMAYYAAQPPQPYPQRNDEAYSDLEDLHAALAPIYYALAAVR